MNRQWVLASLSAAVKGREMREVSPCGGEGLDRKEAFHRAETFHSIVCLPSAETIV
jgi:hypothetical protein